MKRVPRFIANQYGGAHNFRSDKWHIVRKMLKLNNELRGGCAYYPGGNYLADEFDDLLIGLKQELGVKNWGR